MLEDDFVFYRWSDFPGILIFDTADYHIQSLLFKRLAFFVEKRGFSGRILENESLENLHGWNAHDYRAEDLADFYNTAEDRQIVLNSYEIELRGILIEEGILALEDNTVVPRSGGLLSVSRESTPYLRELFLAHEGYHGIFFASPEFEKFAMDLYKNIDPQAENFWKIFLAWKGYDIYNDYLISQ